MSVLDTSDIQGVVLRGYGTPLMRHLFAHFTDAARGRAFLRYLNGIVMTAEEWEYDQERGKKVYPPHCTNVSFTAAGLRALGVPESAMVTFPLEFLEGMRKRADILGDTGRNAPEHWDPVWLDDRVHLWIGICAWAPANLEAITAEIRAQALQSGGAEIVFTQDSEALKDPENRAQYAHGEHFGYRDAISNPDFVGGYTKSTPGAGKLLPDGKTWAPLATGEFLLEYPDEQGELPPAPLPHLLAKNATFMVYRKLHQNLASWRRYIAEAGAEYPGGPELLKAKFVGRWQDGTPLVLSPDKPYDDKLDKKAGLDKYTNFTFSGDPEGVRCPMAAHIRRVNPRDSFGFRGLLTDRRRIIRRGLPYGLQAFPGDPVSDSDDRGVVFFVLNASIFRQFEFVQQQWIDYGNDNYAANEKDPVLGNHNGEGRFMIQGSATDPRNPPFLCTGMPNFVDVKGGDYFFLPGMTGLRLIAEGAVDPL